MSTTSNTELTTEQCEAILSTPDGLRRWLLVRLVQLAGMQSSVAVKGIEMLMVTSIDHDALGDLDDDADAATTFAKRFLEVQGYRVTLERVESP